MGQNLLRVAAELVTEGVRHGSPSMLKRRFRQDHNVVITFEAACAILIELQGAGVVGPADPESHSHPVILQRDEIEAAVAQWQATEPESNQLYECPTCCRVAPWTDGRMRKHGDEIDEYWCQVCGTEVPLSECTKTVLLAA
ncbi:hypothetical protein [Streptomyces sp900116325]|uniref:hypothetical protein n=1 Tax=Streptomyces sp. 900116325 TaxID=3154295 RepID=UPI0033DD074D